MTPVLGVDEWLVIGGTDYKCQDSIDYGLTVREASGRGSGDECPQPIVVGLEDGANISATVLSDDDDLLSYNGKTFTCSTKRGSTTVLSSFVAMVKVGRKASMSGIVSWPVTVTPMELPTQLSHLAY